MPYTPPGVTTEVIIDSNIVQLPGGTRILALIGTGRKTKSISGESVFQPISRVSLPLSQPSILSLDDIYDFTGAGGAQVNYPSSGVGAFGGGYYFSGNQVLWAKAANPYPASTTPAVAATYYVSYTYSGSTVNPTGLIVDSQSNTGYSQASSGSEAAPGNNLQKTFNIPNVIGVGVGVSGIVAVYSGVNTSSGKFPTTGNGVDGAGWFQSGTSLIWSNGGYTDFAAASAAGQVPVSGANYFTHYLYTGTLSSQSYTQTSARTNLIVPTGNILVGNTLITGINSITGTITYPASGSATGIDSLGFGKDGSGWVITGTSTTSGTQYVAWSAVSTGSYGWSAATTAPLSGTYFVDYTFAKSGNDYGPRNFVDYSLVQQEYGPEAEWTLLTSGANAGSYVFNHLNPLTLGARLAFANGASVVTLTQMSGLGTTAGDFQVSLNQLQSRTLDIIVPLSVGSGATLDEISTTAKSQILQASLLHCVTMSSTQNKKERVSVGSLGQAELGDADTEYTYVYEAQSSEHNKRATLIAPGICTVQIQDPNGRFQNIDVDSAFLAVAFGGLSCNPLSDVATPLTRQRVSNFVGISAETTDHPDSSYLEIEKDILGGAGVCVIDRLGSNIFVRHQLTTDQSNPAVGEFSVVTLTDFVSQAVRFTTEQYIGKKLVPAVVVPAVKSTVLATMQQLAQQAIISAIGAITVTVNPTNPTEILVTVQYVPVFPLNRIKVTFTIRTQL